MTKPGQRGSRYAPRGKAYVPRQRERRVTAHSPIILDPPGPTEQSAQPTSAKWHPRQSIAIPIALTIAALALMQQFPSYRLQAGPVQVVAARDEALTSKITRLAMVADDGVQTISNSALPVAARDTAPVPLSTLPADDIAVRDIGHLGAVPLVRACEVPADVPQQPVIDLVAPDQFGSALASAAEAQTREFVVYDDKYRVIRYPGGDVATLYGVCTDVIVRAYRALGIDLQRLVHESHVGSGDTNISHRRVEALRRFFKKSEASLAITDFAEDYLAGDVVTYHRPQNSGSNDHIAIVSNVTGPSGAPMIVHNRGFGPQVEDALFVDEITGHFRYRGPPADPPPLAARSPKGVSGNGITTRLAQKPPHRMRNSTVRKIRRAAAIRAASRSSGLKPTPKL